MTTHVRLGTRGSALALQQAELTRALLRAANPGLEVSIQVIQSLGDLVRDRPLEAIGEQGIFTRALEQALLAGEIDAVVHSAKDLPSRLQAGFTIAGSPPREDPHDCLITLDGRSLHDLPEGARVGTGSPRRVAQLRLQRPDLEFVGVRGNVDTRRRAVLEGRLDGIILAAAGLKRLGLFDEHVSLLPFDECLPQAGQGTLALEAREGDITTIALLRAIHDRTAGACLAAERAVLAGLSAGCQAPVAAYAEVADGVLSVRGLVAGDGAVQPLSAERLGSIDDATALGQAVAEGLRDQGASEWLAAAREKQA